MPASVEVLSNVFEQLGGTLDEHDRLLELVSTPTPDEAAINREPAARICSRTDRFLPKPLRRGPLGMNITSALRHHRSLRAAPQLAQRYRVETARNAEDDPGLAGRVMGYLSRLHRNITPSLQSR